MHHILLNSGPQQAGGAEVRSSILARSLVQRGWPVSFIVSDEGQPEEIETDDGIRVIRGSKAQTGTRILRFFTHTLPSDLRAFQKANADVYIAMSVGWRNALLASKCRRENRKFITWMGSITDPYVNVPGRSRIAKHERWPAHWALQHADIVIAQTEDQKALMADVYGRNCPVIPNIWPVTPADGVKVEPPEVFWAARYIPLKRPELVLEVARHLPHIRFRMAGGPGEGHQELFDRITTMAREIPNVDALGFVPFSEIDQYYARAKVYLCTSTIEGFPNTFLQAWNNLTPVVSTFDPDNVIARHGVGITGKDAEGLALGIERACGNEGAHIASKSRDYLEQVHGVDAVLDALEPLLSI